MRSGTYHGATVTVLHVVPPGITGAVRAQAERALAAFVKQHVHGAAEPLVREAASVRTAILREAERPTSSSSAPRRRPAEGGPRGPSLRRPARGDRDARPADGRRGQDPRDDRPQDLREAGRAGGDAGRGRPGGRGEPGDPDPGRALVRRVELPPCRVRRPAPAGPAQGEAGPDDQPGPADAQRGGDDRPDRGPGDARDDGPGAAPRRDPGDRLGIDRPDPRDRCRPRAPGSSATRTSSNATAASGARAKASGRASTRPAAT